MRVAVLDVGSNTARLLVADVDGTIERVREEKAYLGLGADALRRGRLSGRKVGEAADVARRYARIARKLDAERLETIVTAPGRQAKAGALLDALHTATRGPVRVLSSDDEGRLAFAGALALEPRELPEVVAVCDVGGGSTEIAVGSPAGDPWWVASADLGSLRLTRACFEADPPGRKEIAAGRRLVEDSFAELTPPRAQEALAVGGSARAAAKLVGRTFDEGDLEELVALCARRPSTKVARSLGLDEARAETLLAGGLLLAESSRRLGMPFRLARGGLREGAVLALAARQDLAPAAAA